MLLWGVILSRCERFDILEVMLSARIEQRRRATHRGRGESGMRLARSMTCTFVPRNQQSLSEICKSESSAGRWILADATVRGPGEGDSSRPKTEQTAAALQHLSFELLLRAAPGGDAPSHLIRSYCKACLA